MIFETSICSLQVIPENSVPSSSVKYRSNMSSDQRRHDRLHHGKAHNQRPQHRHSHYPVDDREGHYEPVTQQVCNLKFITKKKL